MKNSKDVEKSAEAELEFSYNKIMNISNYSAWHYRSKLLPIVYPSPESYIGLSESERRKELQLVENAMYTDPADSSAWFYFRWLLSSCSSSNASTKPKLQIVKVMINIDFVSVTGTTLKFITIKLFHYHS